METCPRRKYMVSRTACKGHKINFDRAWCSKCDKEIPLPPKKTPENGAEEHARRPLRLYRCPNCSIRLHGGVIDHRGMVFH
eukprot:m.61643 g.61643  ORF g.61643 m.61643 type:complete len:81 (+) comp13243_c0_seq2:57-299(+)